MLRGGLRNFARVLKRRPSVPTPSTGYDAFISYSHAVDGQLARSLQIGLHRFAKPWYRLRALRVFRDQASLSANPALWTSITQALDTTRWFLLLASPEAARSEWVAKEVTYWCDQKPTEQLLIVLTSGAIAWDDAAADFDWNRTDAVPRTLKGVLAEEPRFIDVSWANESSDVSLRNSRFSEAVADLAAPLHGRPKDELLGEDVRQYRRTRRVAATAIVALTALFVAALIAAFIARAQTNRAEREARIALSRQLAAEAGAAPDDQFDLALLLAAQAYETEPTSQARAGLLRVLARSPQLAGFLPGTEPTTALALGPDGTGLIVGTQDGDVSLWDIERLRRIGTLDLESRTDVTAVAFSPDGRYVAAGDDDGNLALWDAENGNLGTRFSLESRVWAIAFDEGARRLAAGTDDNTITVWDAGSEDPAHVLDADIGDTLAFDGDTLLAGAGQGAVSIWDLGEPEDRRNKHVGAGQPLVSAYSADMSLFANISLGMETPLVADVDSETFLHDDNLDGPALSTDAMAFSPDGETLATAGEGRIILWDVDEGVADPDEIIGAPPGRYGTLALSRAAERVVAGGAQGVAVWHLDAHSLRRSLTVSGTRSISELPNVIRGAASAAFSDNGELVAWTAMDESGGLQTAVWSFDEGREVIRIEDERPMGFSPDSTELGVADFDGHDVRIVDLETSRTRSVARLPWKATGVEFANQEVADADDADPWVTERRGIGASIAFAGTVTLWDVQRRQPLGRVEVPGATDFSALLFDRTGQRLAVATAGGAMSIIDTDVRSWLRKACALAGRTLTDAEWKAYIGPDTSAARSCA